MNKKILIIIVALVLVVAVALILYLFVFSGDSDKEPVYTYYTPSESIVTNVKAPSNKLFKTTVVFVLNTDDSSVVEQLDVQKPMIRDTIIFILREMTEEQIKDTSYQDTVREQIKSTLNEKLSFEKNKYENVIHEILFNDYFMQ